MQIDMELKEVLEVIYTDGNILFVSLFFISSVDKTLKYFIHIHQIMLISTKLCLNNGWHIV